MFNCVSINQGDIRWDIFITFLAAVLAFFFGKYQHKKEYKESLRHEIFGTLLNIDLPKTFYEFINDISSAAYYNEFSSKLKELNSKLSILIIFNQRKYLEIKKKIEDLDDLLAFNEYHLIDGVETPVKITEMDKINARKDEIKKKMLDLYSFLGIEDYKNVLYQDKVMQMITNHKLKKRNKVK